jgi:hypothetical protein
MCLTAVHIGAHHQEHEVAGSQANIQMQDRIPSEFYIDNAEAHNMSRKARRRPWRSNNWATSSVARLSCSVVVVVGEPVITCKTSGL